MNETVVPDSEHRGLVARLPQMPRDLAQLARFDRPIGWWLLFWPCVWGVWLTGAGWQLALRRRRPGFFAKTSKLYHS